MQEAHQYLICGNFNQAIELYSKLIETSPSVSNSYMCRGIAYIGKASYDLAIKDFEKFNELQPNNYQCHFRWGIALFHSSQYAKSLATFKTAEGLAIEEPDKNNISMWKEKCLCELGTSNPTALNASAFMPVEEKKILGGIEGLEKIRNPYYDWYQKEGYVYMTIKLKGVTKEKCEIKIGEEDVILVFKIAEEAPFEYSYKLSAEVVPEKSSYTILPIKIEVKLAKKNEGITWRQFEKIDPGYRPAYPTSSKKKTDWNKLERDITIETAKEKPEGDEAMNKLLKAIFE